MENGCLLSFKSNNNKNNNIGINIYVQNLTRSFIFRYIQEQHLRRFIWKVSNLDVHVKHSVHQILVKTEAIVPTVGEIFLASANDRI